MPSPVLTPARTLAPHTTLRLGGPADRLVEAGSAREIVETLRAAEAAGEPLLLLGGGSNVVVADEGVPGTALLVRTRGQRIDKLHDGTVLLTAEAGEDWDALVAASVDVGLGAAGPRGDRRVRPLRAEAGARGEGPAADRG